MIEYQIDLDTKHLVIRLTVMAETVTLEIAEDIYRQLVEVTSEGGPYAAIYDLSATTKTTIHADAVRSFALHRAPAIPTGRKQVGRGNGSTHLWFGPRVRDVR